MRHRNHHGVRRASACLAGLAALAVCVGACGSSNDSTSTQSSKTTAAASSSATDTTYRKYSAPVTWPGPNDPVKPPAGKKITVITCGSQGITCVRVANGAKAAAQTLGYSATVVDGRSQPTVWNQAIQSAVASKADAIVLAAVPPGLVAGAIAKAKAAKIPVASVLSVLGPPTDVRVNIDRPAVADANAAWIGKDSADKARMLMVRDDEFPETKMSTDAYASAISKNCPGCKVSKSVAFTLALASQRLAGDVAQALRADPSINYVVLPFDTINPFVIEGIRQAGRTGKVKIVGLGADPPSVDALKSGDQAQSLGTAAEWMGWSAVDGLVRTFAGQAVPPFDSKVVSNYSSPLRYVTKANVAQADNGWAGGFDYQSKFKQLWGK
jgi:ribose transport system substrate-binding protein